MVAVLSDTVSNTATMLMPSAQKNQTSLRQEMSQNREFHGFCHRYSTFASACESGSGSAWGTGAGSAWGSGAGAHPQAAQPHGLLRQSTLQCKGIAPVHLSRLPLLPRSHQSRSTCQRLYWHMLQTGRSANGSLLLQTMKAARSYMTISWGGSTLGPKFTAPTGLTVGVLQSG